jgi:hypothetical protein
VKESIGHPTVTDINQTPPSKSLFQSFLGGGRGCWGRGRGYKRVSIDGYKGYPKFVEMSNKIYKNLKK